MIKTYSVTDVMSLHPCGGYPRERVTALWSGREALTASEIAELAIPVDDRVWALCGLATPRTARLFACDCAERALQQVVDAGGSTDPRSWGAIDIARQYADGDRTDEDLRAAEAAAKAAMSVAWYAAWSAAEATARPTAEAAWHAAESAARSAANAAAESIDWSAAESMERTWLLRHLVEMMEADNA